MAQKEPLSRPVLITGVIVPVVLGMMAILGNILTTRLPPASNATATSTEATSSESQPQSGSSLDSGTAEQEGDLNVKAGDTVSAFGGKVFIALIKTAPQGEPAHDTVYATLSSDDNGVKDWRLKGVDAGYSCQFNGFKVRVMSVEPDRARFRVTPLAVTVAPDTTNAPVH